VAHKNSKDLSVIARSAKVLQRRGNKNYNVREQAIDKIEMF